MDMSHYGVMRPNMGYYHQQTSQMPMHPPQQNSPMNAQTVMHPSPPQTSPQQQPHMAMNHNMAAFRGSHHGMYVARGPMPGPGGNHAAYFSPNNHHGGNATMGGPGNGVYAGFSSPLPYQHQQQQQTMQQHHQQQQQQQQQHHQQHGYLSSHHLNQQQGGMQNQHMTQHNMHQFGHSMHQVPNQQPLLPPPSALAPPASAMSIHGHMQQAHFQQPVTPHHLQHPPHLDVMLEVNSNRDPVAKAKLLVVAVRRSLEHLLDVAEKNLKYNAEVDMEGVATGITMPPPPPFDSALEEFVLVCNRLELQLQIVLENRKVANASQRFVPLTVNLSKSDAVSPQEDGTLSFNQYLSIVKSQVEFIHSLRSSIMCFSPVQPASSFF